jgi:hypothetical protein
MEDHIKERLGLGVEQVDGSYVTRVFLFWLSIPLLAQRQQTLSWVNRRGIGYWSWFIAGDKGKQRQLLFMQISPATDGFKSLLCWQSFWEILPKTKRTNRKEKGAEKVVADWRKLGPKLVKSFLKNFQKCTKVDKSIKYLLAISFLCTTITK